MPKSSVLDKNHAISFLYNFFQNYSNWFRQKTNVNQEILDPFLSNDFLLTSNGQVLCSSISDYVKRLQKFQKKYTRFDISKPLEEPLIQGNQLVVHYKVDLTTQDGQSKQIYIMGIGTLENNKLARWSQVTHQKGSEEWDK